MRVYYDISARIVEFGSPRFYEYVREHVSEILTECRLDITGDLTENLYHLYQRYATAYIIGSTADSVELFLECLAEEYEEGDSESLVLVTDDSAQRLRLAGFDVNSAFQDIEADVFYSNSFTHRVFPGCDGDESEHAKALEMARALFTREHEHIPEGGLMPMKIGLASVVSSLTPGVYVEHYGDDYKTLVVICEHESLF